MTEHLFKLKKDGKTVGWLLIAKGKMWGKTRYECDEWSEWTNWGFMFDTAHPFVTKDKNGKDVFADDEVDSMGNRCRVMWHKVMLQWCLWHIEGDYYFGSITSKHDIELIEDK